MSGVRSATSGRDGHGGRSSTSRGRRVVELVRRSTRLVWSCSPRLFVALVALQIVAAASLGAQVLVVAQVLERILDLTEAGVTPGLVWSVAALAGLMALGALIAVAQGSVRRLLGELVARSMNEKVQDVATTVPLRNFEDPEFFENLQRVRQSAMTRPFQVTQGLFTVIGTVASSVAVGAALVALYPWLLPLLAVGAVPVLLTSRRESALEFRFTVAQTTNQRERTYVNYVQTNRDEAKEIRAFQVSPWLRDRYRALYDSYLEALRKHLGRRLRLATLGQVLSGVVLVGTLLLLVVLIANGEVGVADAGAAIVGIRALQGQIQGLVGGVQQIHESGLYLDDLEAFFRHHADEATGPAGADDLPPFDGARIEKVSFRYPGSGTEALQDVTIEVGRGEVVAVVGENGSGKTTAAKVLAGLYEPDAGDVLWGETPYAKLSQDDLRSRVAVIFQDFVRYAFSATENIALDRAGIDARQDPAGREDVRAAARAADIDGALSRLPHGYATRLSRMFDDSADLSGGQWQRLAIARAFYRDADLVILDEPSAALDPRAEHDLFSSLRTTLRGRSALFISHRFATVRGADRIYVMDSGRVVESGTHTELMARRGLYAELFELQAGAYFPDGWSSSAP
ncbi:ATP-binding cassette subfamily B protein [Isoptericola sp. CG 20/1183]|uniref:ATP-binding cassette subfamily B protein n=1 Tax=Isoptericola halotolerans TaxID=300560 RepID=A0ABX5EG37_9MICO|nr:MULTISPECIES: ABC transporter ATP-binding protein [Isoptericola]PRZ06430.1 ATP-binding cassette subfamily B protein [Isoptericola halotolerans]PRZ06764.1 ATP-binding cassette subfamily B protein [Isoptericola sp. CG 20/1183]